MTSVITCQELVSFVDTDQLADDLREAVGDDLAVKLRAFDPEAFAVPGSYWCRSIDVFATGC